MDRREKTIAQKIIEHFPQEDVGRYVEVFGGAGWVLFGKEKIKGQLEVFNDVDSHLINLYRCIKYHCGELQRELRLCLISREQFLDSKAQLNVRGLTDIQRAARYFIMIKISFGADRRSFGTNTKSLAGSIDYLPDICDRLEGVVIENKDFEDLIKVYNRSSALFYLDPPYIDAEQHYDAGFGMDDHRRLRAVLGTVKGKFILSYNNDPRVTEMYSSFDVQEVSRNNNLLAKRVRLRYTKRLLSKIFR